MLSVKIQICHAGLRFGISKLDLRLEILNRVQNDILFGQPHCEAFSDPRRVRFYDYRNTLTGASLKLVPIYEVAQVTNLRE